MISLEIKYLASASEPVDFEDFCSNKSELLLPFSDDSLLFIDALSKCLLCNPEFKKYPEMVALGYWLRRSNIERLKHAVNAAFDSTGYIFRMPRGLVFHVAPSNVDTIFIYSLVISMLMGNKNLVRLSSKSSEQQKLILLVLNDAIKKLPDNKASNNLVVMTYPHDESTTQFISSNCDARMLWGGNNTVNLFSSIPVSPTAIDIKFANKYSLAILCLETISKFSADELQNLAKSFVNDCYLFGQQGCSSPRAVFWLGDFSEFEPVSSIFWQAVRKELKSFVHGLSDSDFVEKLIFSCKHAILNNSTLEESDSLLLSVLRTDLDGMFVYDDHCGRGVFLETHVLQLEEISPFLNREIQTLTYCGVEKSIMLDWLKNGVNGIDRIVPVGQALNFDYIWDGLDLFASLSRIVTYK